MHWSRLCNYLESWFAYKSVLHSDWQTTGGWILIQSWYIHFKDRILKPLVMWITGVSSNIYGRTNKQRQCTNELWFIDKNFYCILRRQGIDRKQGNYFSCLASWISRGNFLASFYLDWDSWIFWTMCIHKSTHTGLNESTRLSLHSRWHIVQSKFLLYRSDRSDWRMQSNSILLWSCKWTKNRSV